MNEPRVIGSAEEWTGGTQESYDVINQLFQAFVDTVRASGGSNTDRTVIVTDYAQSAEKHAIGGMIVPKDDHIIVSLHIYAPWNFCGPDDTRADWGSDSDKQELDTTFQYLDDTFISKGIPVIIDETGCVNKNENTSARVLYLGQQRNEKRFRTAEPQGLHLVLSGDHPGDPGRYKIKLNVGELHKSFTVRMYKT